MFEEIIPENEVKFNDLEKKVFKFVCFFGCLIIKMLLESYDRKLMNARDTKKYRHKGLVFRLCLLSEPKLNKLLMAIAFEDKNKKIKKLPTFT